MEQVEAPADVCGGKACNVEGAEAFFFKEMPVGEASVRLVPTESPPFFMWGLNTARFFVGSPNIQGT